MGIPGMVEIGANEVGIVRKKIGSSLPPGKHIALYGEAGYQADILPPGTYFGYLSLQYDIRKEPVINIPQGEIGLVVAKDGETTPRVRNLGRVVECSDFQDARAFLENGGEKGRQLGILTAGIYGINTELFTIITSANASLHGMNPEDLKVYEIAPDKIGIVVTKDGQAILTDDIAGAKIDGHNNFQNPQQFIDRGGYKGLQEETLVPGFWNLNPWFVKVKQVYLTKVPPGTVGVVISDIGKNAHNLSNELVEEGYKGIQKKTLPTGKYPINTDVKDVVMVPTHDITLDWSNKDKPTTNYDANLDAIELNSHDGFKFSVHLTQVFHIPAENAPMMISRLFSEKTEAADLTSDSSSDNDKFTSIRSLVMRVIEPMVKAHFTACAKKSTVRGFRERHEQIQKQAEDEIEVALGKYGVKALHTSISQIDLPDDMEEYYRQRAKTEQERESLVAEMETNIIRQQQILQEQAAKNQLEKLRSQGESEITINQAQTQIEISQVQAQVRNQQDKYRSEAEVEIAKNQAQAQIYNSQAQAESISQIGMAEAGVLEAKLTAEVRSLGGFGNYIDKLRIENLPEIQLPSVLVSNGGQSGLLDAFVAPMLLGNPNPNQALLAASLLQSSSTLPNNPPQLAPSLPRCPIILLVDTSSSMSREYLDKLTEGINTFKEQLSQDKTTSQCVEIAILTFGGSPEIVQSWTSTEAFSTPQLTLGGKAATGQGIAKAIKMVESCKNIYQKKNIQYYQPWVFLIIGSNPDDNWQDAAQQVQQAVGNKQLNFLTVGVENADVNILNQIAPPQIPPTILENLKFKPLFHWLAFQMKRIVHRQEQENLLTGLAEVVEQAKSSLNPEQAEQLSEHTAGVIKEVCQEQPSRNNYSHHAGALHKVAQQMGEQGQKIVEIIPNITKSVKLS